jgi:hypothetical protein
MTVRVGLGIALVMSLQHLRVAAQPVRERVNVAVIRISITAQTSSRKPVRDLVAEDLTLLVDGQPVRIDSLTASSPAARQQERPPEKTAESAVTPVPEPVPARRPD